MDEIVRKKRIAIIANFCDYGKEHTNNRFNYLAEVFSNNGYDVELITSTFAHREKKQREIVEDRNGYSTRLIYEPTYKRNVSLKRFYSHKIWGKGVEKYLKGIDKPDLVYCAIPSLDAANKVSKYCKRNDIPFVIDVQDLWPEAFQMVFRIPILSRLIFLPFKRKANRVYGSADAVVAVSETYAKRALMVNKKTKNACVVYLGTDLKAFDTYCTKYSKNTEVEAKKFFLGYCGTLGASYDLTSVMDALEILHNKGIKDIQFLVMGSGPLKERFEAYAKEKSCEVLFAGKLPYDEMCARLAFCDIAVNSITKGAAQSIINKHGDYLAAGLPIVNTQECEEFRNLIDQYECGINCENQAAEQIAKAIEELLNDSKKRLFMGENARKLAEERFDRKKSYLKILQTVEILLDKTNLEVKNNKIEN